MMDMLRRKAMLRGSRAAATRTADQAGYYLKKGIWEIVVQGSRDSLGPKG
jgi:hypothetical protein